MKGVLMEVKQGELWASSVHLPDKRKVFRCHLLCRSEMQIIHQEADPKGQLLFFFGGGEEKFGRITTEN